jgi:hypothetical protein
MERQHLATQILDRLGRLRQAQRVAEVLRHSPDGRVAQRPVPADELLRRRDIPGHGLLAEHVLPRRQRLLDHLGLVVDGQHDDDGLDVAPREQVVERLARLAGAVVVLVDRGLGPARERVHRRLGARVDGEEVEVVRCLDGGEVFCLLLVESQLTCPICASGADSECGIGGVTQAHLPAQRCRRRVMRFQPFCPVEALLANKVLVYLAIDPSAVRGAVKLKVSPLYTRQCRDVDLPALDVRH